MSPKQWIVLSVAAVAAGGALVLVRGARPNEATATTAEAPRGPSVLVAARDIAMGKPVTAEDLMWAEWPEAALNETFVQQSKTPAALDESVGAVARSDIRKGEPIYEGRLVKRGEGGVLSAILTPGYRAVALEISPSSASAGFIEPNDRVDVLLTRVIERQNGSITISEPRSGLILTNVRVLAMGKQVRQSPPGDQGPQPIEASVATLELSPRDAEILLTAAKLGDVSLALRGIETASKSGALKANPFASEVTLETPVRVHAFGNATEQSVPRVLQ